MFKKVLVAALVALPMCLQAQSLKFGVLNPSEIVQVMPEYATAQNTLKAASDKYEAQAKTLQEEYNKKLGELETLEKNKADQATMDAKINEIQDLQQRMQTFQQTASKDMKPSWLPFSRSSSTPFRQWVEQVAMQAFLMAACCSTRALSSRMWLPR